MPTLDAVHLAAVRAVLEAIPETSVARAALACEDAYVALTLGLSMGLSLTDVKRLTVELLTDDAPNAITQSLRPVADSPNT